MGVIVLPCQIREVEDVYSTYFAAFQNEPMAQTMLKILFPGGHESPEFRKAHAAATVDYWHKTLDQYTGKVVDTVTSEIIGMLLVDVFLRERSEEERKNHGVPWLEGKERERAEAVLNPLWEMREKLWGGRKYIYVHVIGIRPENQGLKAGIAMISWGVEISDGANMPIYIEASPSTWQLYERVGFQRIKEKIVHSKEVLGTDEDIEVPLMVRMPASAKGMTFDDWREQGYPPFEEQAFPL